MTDEEKGCRRWRLGMLWTGGGGGECKWELGFNQVI